MRIAQVAPLLESVPPGLYGGTERVISALTEEFHGQAYAYLFPIDWPEPFGLTMVEAMACGTPVIAMHCGSVSEVVTDGITGRICNSLPEFIDAVPGAGAIDRARCRAHAEARFSVSVMADGYEAVYRRITLGWKRGPRAARPSLPIADAQPALG